MKLSNKILIGFFGFTFLYMIVAFAELRFKGDSYRLNVDNSISESVDIERINYLVINDVDQRVAVLADDTPRIEVKSISGDMLQHLKYEISGDTLALKPYTLEGDHRLKIVIYVSKDTFIGLSSTNTHLTITDLQQETLDINQNDGKVFIVGSSKIGTLSLTAKNSAAFILESGSVNTLHLAIDSTQVRVLDQIHLLTGAMSNDSYLELYDTEELQFKKDETSRLVIR